MLYQFLKEFAALSKSQQEVFLFCVKHCPRPQKHSGDVRYICQATNLTYKTVLPALYAINQSKLLSKVVQYIHTDISGSKFVPLDSVPFGGVPFDWEEVGRVCDN